MPHCSSPDGPRRVDAIVTYFGFFEFSYRFEFLKNSLLPSHCPAIISRRRIRNAFVEIYQVTQHMLLSLEATSGEQEPVMVLWNSHASRRTTSLADLPNELLIMIFYQISTNDIVAVACICRRLNEVMFDGAGIFPCLTLPRLTNLLCRGPNTSLVAVSAFLSRHPNLQSLHLLGGTSPTNMSLLQDGVGSFPCMKSISASADTLTILLEFLRAFPLLQEVCMQGPITANDTKIRLVQDIFMLISQIPTITAIKFPSSNLASKGWDSFDYRAVNATRFTSAEEFSVRAESLLMSITKLTASAMEGHNYGVQFFRAVACCPFVSSM